MSSEFPKRINKYLAEEKYSTRRGADKLIEAKQVWINGKLAKLGDKVEQDDHVEVKLKGVQAPRIYVAYNKPKGVVTHSAGPGEREIIQEVPIKGIFPIGRLDKESHGLIILTNDGRITDRLLGPSYNHEKEYLVKTKGKLRNNFKERMEEGVRIDKETTAPCKVKIIDDYTFKVILTEGKKHQIRRMCVALFQEVEDLERIRIMNITNSHLGTGEYREITGGELEEFLRALDLV